MMNLPKKIRPAAEDKKRPYLSQSDVPSCSLEEALRIPKAIQENYGGGSVTPVQLATAVKLRPTSSSFTMLCGAAMAYGLTDGASQAEEIKLKPLALRILKPQEDGDEHAAKLEALLTPRVIKEFLQKYNGAPIPREEIGQNVLETMGVPRDKTSKVFSLIISSADTLGLISEIRGKKYVELKGAKVKGSTEESPDAEKTKGSDEQQGRAADKGASAIPLKPPTPPAVNESKRRRVYITHGKDKTFVEPIRKLLKFGELEAIVSTERASVAQPVPDKVMEDMRSCGAAIIHIDAELKLFDKDTVEHIVLNPNVLIEIGAAMALYGRRYIFLVRSGVTLPSNLQGLFEVRYDGDTLGGDSTIKLLEAINDMKSRPFPSETSAEK